MINRMHYGCLMVHASFDGWVDMWSRKIDSNDLYIDEDDNIFGIKNDPHITIAYGFDGDIDTNLLLNRLTPHKASDIKIDLVEITKFDNEKYDVLICKCESQMCADLNKKLLDEYGIVSQWPQYIPHITIAYLKKGTADKYIESLNSLTISPEYYYYSTPDGYVHIFV